MKGYKAGLVAVAIAILVYGMPVQLALLSTANGLYIDYSALVG
ncbi:MAG: hypothetical protein JWQ40_1856 [Segetibacter sp.]|nr:hypothetical protein [Segetibacter sp.]